MGDRWTKGQTSVVIAAYLGWTLDAFDFFILVFVFSDVAADFHASNIASIIPLTLTLAARPVGAYLFGRLGDRYGRKPMLMWNIVAFSILEALSGVAPSIGVLLAVRCLFGIAMGGQWGLGASLTFETIPTRARGWVSGVLQAGYPSGFFLASLAYRLFYDHLGWRGLFFVGALPSLLVLFIWRAVPESPAWRGRLKINAKASKRTQWRQEWRLVLYTTLLMTCFNLFSHGSQDTYPNLFLKQQHHFDTASISLVTMVLNVGAIGGGIMFGLLSQRLGRRRGMMWAAALALIVLPFWAFSRAVPMLAASAFLMQLCVQGAWGIVPVYLNELSPATMRATLPGVVYQLGNLLASINAPLQVAIAVANGNNYGVAMALVTGSASILIILMLIWGPERQGVSMADT